jgi:hypothetical protein
MHALARDHPSRKQGNGWSLARNLKRSNNQMAKEPRQSEETEQLNQEKEKRF